MSTDAPKVTLAAIEAQIYSIRGHCERVELKAPGTRRRPPCGEKVMLDADLAALYEVETKTLNRAVKRNFERFPEDFMFQLSEEEFSERTARRGGRRYAPYAFTEQGVAMLSSVLRSDRAIHVNIEIMRAFVRLRQLLATNAELARKLAALEKKYDQRFKAVFEAIRELMEPDEPKKKRPIGFAEWERK